MHECDRHTHTQRHDNIGRACIASRGKNDDIVLATFPRRYETIEQRIFISPTLFHGQFFYESIKCRQSRETRGRWIRNRAYQLGGILRLCNIRWHFIATQHQQLLRSICIDKSFPMDAMIRENLHSSCRINHSGALCQHEMGGPSNPLPLPFLFPPPILPPSLSLPSR